MGLLAELDPPTPHFTALCPGSVPVHHPTEHPPRRPPRIGQDTPILPHVVAAAVWQEASVWLEAELPRAWIAELAERADVIYAHNPRFRRLLRRRGDASRDWLWAFTRHWLTALIGRHSHELLARLPESYHVGNPLPLRRGAPGG